jgi:Fe2+ or Zn2+ uptake regulation protein
MSTATKSVSDTAERDAFRRALQDAGLRVTAPRITVLQVLQEGGHLSAERVFTEVNKRLSGTSIQTVYGVLEAFCRVELARKLDPKGGHSALFEIKRHDNHHHLVCRDCGRVEDTECVIGSAPCLTPADSAGFSVEAAEVTFYGLCPSCRAKQSDASTASAA